MTGKSPEFNDIAGRAINIVEEGGLAARIQAPFFSRVELPLSESLWVESIYWACDTLDGTATTANLDNTSPHEMSHRIEASVLPHPCLKSFTEEESRFYVRPSHDHLSGFLCILTQGRKFLRCVT